MKPRYHYATMRVCDIEPILHVPFPEDSYLSQDNSTKTLAELLAKGYRWIRTDGEIAVFEKEITGAFNDIVGCVDLDKRDLRVQQKRR